MNAETKKDRYQRIHQQLTELLTATTDPIAAMATIAAVLHHKFKPFFWTGFYRLTDGELTVGPYQGPLACQKLEKDTGVCWAAINSKKTIMVPDVSKFPGHIACDARSRSEIVVPCIDKSGNPFAVLDIDSAELNTFDQIDAAELEKIAKLVKLL